MNVIFGLYTLAWLLIWGAVIRLIELHWKGSPLSQALGVIY